MVHRQNYFYLNYNIHQNRRRKDNKRSLNKVDLNVELTLEVIKMFGLL
nr:MAG TPA: hypothetical protein [Caudoviricetes sp.]